MEKAMKIFAIIVIAMYIILIGVLVYEFIEMKKDHECWIAIHSKEDDTKCRRNYGLK